MTNFNELVQAQQNVYNVGYDLAVVLATLGTALDGDLGTTRLTLGKDGLNTHNKFEADSSLTRNDYYLANGDNYNFNGTLFGYMTQTCNKVYDRACMTKYRAQRYQQSLGES